MIRHLDKLRHLGRLSDGVPWDGHGGLIQVDLNEYDPPPQLTDGSPDNAIIAVAWHLLKSGRRTVFISKDINARIKSDTLGIPTEDFEAQKVDAAHLYTGYIELDVDQQLIDRMFSEEKLPVDALRDAIAEGDVDNENEDGATVFANQFVLLRSATNASQTGLGRRKGDEDVISPAPGPRKPVYSVIARNVQQTMALDLLMDENIKLVTLLGTAGSGKTLLAVAAGLTRVVQDEAYDRLLVARPIMPMGRDIGFLPGSKDEKLEAWMQPIFDNLGYLMSSRTTGPQTPDSKTTEQRIQQLMGSGVLVLEPLTYIRGRSIPNQFMIVDEAQNLTPHEVKTIASRVGEGTKLVLTGDIEQIDNPYLDSSSNGLSYMVEQLKDHGIVGHVLLQRSERSELASLVAEVL